MASIGERRIRRILVATDGARSARDAVELGVELAEAGGATVTFVHVVPAEASADEWIRPAPERLRADGDAALDEAAAIAADHDVAFERELIAGDPRDVIVALADAIEADLIVVGERPRRLRVAPSVSRWVARHTRRAILVTRPPVRDLAA
jgi:nucleotide-binding universal stress UspA family protein